MLKCELLPDHTGFKLMAISQQAEIGFHSALNGEAEWQDNHWVIYTDNVRITW
ncbi:hypothetical protein GCM10023333_14760 [Ferrimonas pelagia]|uniref:Uncharacterized protein n=1 Tax=Ferrimonas pelagia TaxID=1177826 RepID=A0ABP9ELD1_9GAMM